MQAPVTSTSSASNQQNPALSVPPPLPPPPVPLPVPSMPFTATRNNLPGNPQAVLTAVRPAMRNPFPPSTQIRIRGQLESLTTELFNRITTNLGGTGKSPQEIIRAISNLISIPTFARSSLPPRPGQPMPMPSPTGNSPPPKPGPQYPPIPTFARSSLPPSPGQPMPMPPPKGISQLPAPMLPSPLPSIQGVQSPPSVESPSTNKGKRKGSRSLTGRRKRKSQKRNKQSSPNESLNNENRAKEKEKVDQSNLPISSNTAFFNETLNKIQSVSETMDFEMKKKELPTTKVRKLLGQYSELKGSIRKLEKIAKKQFSLHKNHLGKEKEQPEQNAPTSLTGSIEFPIQLNLSGSKKTTASGCKKTYNRFTRAKKAILTIEAYKKLATEIHMTSLSYHKYLEREKTGDVSIHVGESSFKVHKEVLVQSSEFFESMFRTESFKESLVDEEGLQNISLDLPKLPIDLLEKLIVYFYIGVLEIKESSEIFDYLICADSILIEELKKHCLKHLYSTLDNTKVLELYEISNLKGCKTNRDLFLPYICLNALHCLVQAKDEQLGHLSFESLAFILQQDDLSLQESQVLQVIYKWLTIKIISKQLAEDQIPFVIKNLCACVRLPLCSPDELYNNWHEKKIEGYLLLQEDQIIEACDQFESQEIQKSLARKTSYQTFPIQPKGKSRNYPDHLFAKGINLSALFLSNNLEIPTDCKTYIALNLGSLYFCFSVPLRKEVPCVEPTSFLLRLDMCFSEGQPNTFIHTLFVPITITPFSFNRLLMSKEELSLLPEGRKSMIISLYPLEISEAD